MHTGNYLAPLHLKTKIKKMPNNENNTSKKNAILSRRDFMTKMDLAGAGIALASFSSVSAKKNSAQTERHFYKAST